MQGESFESARKEIGLDHAARALVSHAGSNPSWAITRGLETQLVMVLILV